MSSSHAAINNRARFFREVYWEFRAGRSLDFPTIRAHLLRWIIEVSGVRVRIHPTLSYTVVKSLLAAAYEVAERALIESALRSDDVVMELGGGLGYISTVCARQTDSSRVFVYEANPLMEPLIRDTFRLNNVSPELNTCMVGEAAGSTTLHLGQDFWNSSTVASNKRGSTVAVKVVSLHDELARIKPTVLIADIEGGEYELFRSFPSHACRMIMLELHPKILGEERAAETLAAIEAMGFRSGGQMEQSYVFHRI